MLMLMKRLDDLHSEQAYLKDLRGDDSEDNTASEEEEKAEGEDDEDKLSPAEKKAARAEMQEAIEAKEMEERIGEDPTEAARYYHRILNVTK